MFSNAVKAAFNNLARNRLYAGISILGLAVGILSVLLTTLYVLDELSFDRFIPDHRRVYVLISEIENPGQAPISMDYAPQQVAVWLKSELPGISQTARLSYDQQTVESGEISASEAIAWIDPSFLRIVRLPVLHGQAENALDRPDSVVITERVAEKFFGDAGKALGKSLMLAERSMVVTAVLRDLPDETHLRQQVFASGVGPMSPLTRMNSPDAPQSFLNMVFNDAPAKGPPVQFVRGRVYVQVADGAAVADLNSRLMDFSSRHAAQMRLPPGAEVSFRLVRLDELHLYPFKGANLGATDVRGSASALRALAVIAVLVLALAGINFINLTTARASRRAIEVGVRKASGARRNQLIAQFVGEAGLYVLLAAGVALSFAEILLPTLNAMLLRSMSLASLATPLLALGLLGLLLVFALLAAAYPAFVLSSFRPAAVLKGGGIDSSGSMGVRQALIVFQFSILVVLVVAVAAVWLQTRYAMSAGLSLDKDNVVVVHATPCRGAFEQEARRLSEVATVSCSSRAMLGLDDFAPMSADTEARADGRPSAMLSLGLVDFGFFELYKIKPLAGRAFDRRYGADELPLLEPGGSRSGNIIVNQTAALRLGFDSPEAAIDKTVMIGGGGVADRFTIIGVVPDFTLDLRNAAVKPTGYVVDFASYPLDQVLSIRLAGSDSTDVMATIENAWRASGKREAMRWQFLDDYVRQLYASTIREGILVSALCGIALLLAVLGLFGLAAFTADRRTKEIGVRKAMGARTRDILGLMMWQFTVPVLVANLIGLPLAFVIVQRWLEGFTYRIDLSPALFIVAFVFSLVVAWATVLSHAVGVARRKPIHALRYE